MSHPHSYNTRETGVSFAAVAMIHIVGWGMLLASADWSNRSSAITFGTGVLAYLLGLRHAFDADHIAAIDNSTRKLITAGRNPGATGLFFSLGHSTVVLVFSALIALGFSAIGHVITDENSPLRAFGGAVGSFVAGSFLVVIAILNLFVLFSLLKAARKLRNGVTPEETDAQLDEQLSKRGILTRLFGPVAKLIDRPWKMFPLGVLFGLGFDTASSIAMLAIAGGTEASKSNPFAIIALPLVFMAGMSLGDTVDGYLMQRAYGWAHGHTDRRLRYNIAVTTVSILAAVAIGIPILVELFANSFQLSGGVWDFILGLDFEYVGFALLGLFLMMWAIGWLAWKSRRIPVTPA